MTQEEKRCFLLRELLKENPQYQSIGIPQDPEEQSNLLRALMNVRPADKISKSFLDIQDQYLCEERDARGVVHCFMAR